MNNQFGHGIFPCPDSNNNQIGFAPVLKKYSNLSVLASQLWPPIKRRHTFIGTNVCVSPRASKKRGHRTPIDFVMSTKVCGSFANVLATGKKEETPVFGPRSKKTSEHEGKEGQATKELHKSSSKACFHLWRKGLNSLGRKKSIGFQGWDLHKATLPKSFRQNYAQVFEHLSL